MKTIKISLTLLIISFSFSSYADELWGWDKTYEYYFSPKPTQINDKIEAITYRESPSGNYSESIDANKYSKLVSIASNNGSDEQTEALEELSKHCITANTKENISIQNCLEGRIIPEIEEFYNFYISMKQHSYNLTECLKQYSFNKRYKELSHDKVRDTELQNVSNTICEQYGSFENNKKTKMILEDTWTKTNNGSVYGFYEKNININTSNSEKDVSRKLAITCNYLTKIMGNDFSYDDHLCDYHNNFNFNNSGGYCSNPTSNVYEAKSTWPVISDRVSRTERYWSTCTRRVKRSVTYCTMDECKTSYYWTTESYQCRKSRTVTETKVYNGIFDHGNNSVQATCDNRNGTGKLRVKLPQPDFNEYKANKNGHYAILKPTYSLSENSDNFARNILGLNGCVGTKEIQYHKPTDKSNHTIFVKFMDEARNHNFSNSYKFYPEKRYTGILIPGTLETKTTKVAECYY